MSIPGWATRDPLKLCPCVRERWRDFATECKAREIPILLIETARDIARQRYYKSIGVSRTLKSMHLPQPPNGLSLAFDACPREYLRVKGWSPGGLLWPRLGRIGREGSLRLLWGGDWRTFPDLAHWYLERCLCP